MCDARDAWRGKRHCLRQGGGIIYWKLNIWCGLVMRGLEGEGKEEDEKYLYM
jgi:hypothetical protein